MSGFETECNEHLIRCNIWSAQIKEALLHDLAQMRFTRIVAEFEEATLEPMLDAMLALAQKPVSLPVAVAMGAAAAVIKNPVVSRRFWSK